MVRALGDKIQIEESPMTNMAMAVFNCQKKPFDDPRVRRAMALAVDHWEGARVLPKIAMVKWVGALLRPGSEFALRMKSL